MSRLFAIAKLYNYNYYFKMSSKLDYLKKKYAGANKVLKKQTFIQDDDHDLKKPT